MVNRNLLRQYDLPETELQQELAAAFNQDVYQNEGGGDWLPQDDQVFEVNKIVNGRVLNVVGDEVWDQQSRVRIRMGPLSLEQYMEFLPGGPAWRHVKALTRFFAGNEYDMELQLVLRRDEVPSCELQIGRAHV